MKIKAFLFKQKSKLLSFIHLQLFLTLVSLPILLAWGLPLSILTFAGNFLFAPILTAFLFFCSLVFFCNILHLPNGIFIFCLEKITSCWLWLLQLASTHCLVAFTLPSIAMLITIPILTFGILHHKKVNTHHKGIICYGSLLLALCLIMMFSKSQQARVDFLACNNGNVTCITDDKQLVIIDPGVIGRRLSAPSWCEYTLMPYLAKQYGTTTIDHLILLQPNKIIFDAMSALLEKIIIKNLYISQWDGTMPLYWWYSYMKLVRICATKQCKLVRIGKRPINFPLNQSKSINNVYITISLLDQVVTKDTFSYHCIQVHATVDNQALDIYSAKHTKSSS